MSRELREKVRNEDEALVNAQDYINLVWLVNVGKVISLFKDRSQKVFLSKLDRDVSHVRVATLILKTTRKAGKHFTRSLKGTCAVNLKE